MKIEDIKSFLKQNKITYEKLSELSGISISALKKIFSGQAKYPRVDTVEAIEKALGLDEKPYDWYMLTPQENELITEYRQLIPAMRDYILDSVKKLNDAQKNNRVRIIRSWIEAAALFSHSFLSAILSFC